jgi:hypothetical protein
MSQKYDSISNTPNADFKKGIEDNNQQPQNAQPSKSFLKDILESQKKLKERKAKPVIFSPPIISHLGNAVIYPNTINVVQGQAGAHKSRLAELMCSALLKNPECKIMLAGFDVSHVRSFSVCIVDTERNVNEQLPFALQSIQTKAGYRIEEHPKRFDFITLLTIPRKERFNALRDYLEYIKEIFNTHIFIVLDVLTDCVEDFNQTNCSMELIDHLNTLINDYDVTFLCVIHENPGHAKARGHLGTELINKASTVMQVGYEQDAAGKDTDLIRVKFLKCRNTRRHEPFYLKYCDTFKGLVLADETEIKKNSDLKKIKAAAVDVADKIEQYLQGEPITGKALTELLMRDFAASQRTIDERIKEIIGTDTGFTDKDGKHCQLDKFKEKREITYRLTPRD